MRYKTFELQPLRYLRLFTSAPPECCDNTREKHRSRKENYTSIDPKQQQRMFPPRSCAMQNWWNCLAHSCLLFYSFVTSTTKQIMMEQHPFPEERKKREEARQAPEPKKREEGTGTPAETKRNQQTMMEQNPFPEEKKEGRQAPEPQPEPGGTSKSWWNRTPFLRKEERRSKTSTGTLAGTRRSQKSWWNRTPFLRKERREKKGDKHRNQRRENKGDKHPNPSWNQEEPANHDPQPEPGGTSKSWWNRTPVLRKERREKKGDKHRNQRREKKGDKHRNPSRNQEEPANHDGTEPLSWGKKEERRRETSTRTPAGTKRNQQTMMEQNPFPEERKKREEARQAPETQTEPGGASKSWWNRTRFLRKERREKKQDKHRNQRREKKGDKHRNPSRNQEEPAKHDGTEPLSWRKKTERRREASTRTPAGTKRNQQTRMEQNPFPEERKKREEGGQAPKPRRSQQILREQRPFLARSEIPIQLKSCLGNHDGTEPLSWGKKEERRRDPYRQMGLGDQMAARKRRVQNLGIWY